jgi:hypothetical protein
MYRTNAGLVIGFHGCDESIRDNVVTGKSSLGFSKNQYDWLGHGMYFWEGNVARALLFAQEWKAKPRTGKDAIVTPSVLGAVIDLGNCLDLLDSQHQELVKLSYGSLQASYDKIGKTLPQNLKGAATDDLLLRNLDCAVIENLHRQNTGDQFDTARGVFIEGQRLYPNCGFYDKTHIQLCVRNPNSIKAYFVPRTVDHEFGMV